MAFQIKNFPSIVASMVNRMKAGTTKITDFSVGSIARTLVEAPANEIDQCYQQVMNGLLEAIPVATYNTFNFAALVAMAASGLIGVNITAQATDTLIPAGTVFQYTGGSVTYTSAADVTIPAGNTNGNVLVGASATGPVGNIPAGTSFTPTTPITGFTSASNAAAFVNGRDAETDAQRKQRFQAYIKSLARATVAGLIYGCSTAVLLDQTGSVSEQVLSASVNDTIGTVTVYVHNGTNTVASSALLTQVTNILLGYIDPNTGQKVPGYKAAGVNLVVSAATSTNLNVTANVSALPGYDSSVLAPLVQTAITNYILSLGIGDTFECSQAVFLAKSIKGVDNYTMSAPTTDQTTNFSHKLMPGTIAITGI